jgi:uncharacterized protein YuzE
MITYSEESDAVYIKLSNSEVARTEVIDDARFVDYDSQGQVVGVELLGASAGLDLRGLPEQDRLREAVMVLRFPVRPTPRLFYSAPDEAHFFPDSTGTWGQRIHVLATAEVTTAETERLYPATYRP